MAVSTDRNLASLRDTYDRISTTIARFSFVRAVVFAFGAFALASALNAVGSSEANEIINKIREASNTTQTEPEFQDTFLTAIYSGHFKKEAAANKDAETATNEEAEASSPTTPKREITEQEKKAAKTEQDSLVAQLRKIIMDAFTFSFKAPMLGADVKIDLRIWGFLLWPLFVLAEVYLCVLRIKRRTIHTLGCLILSRDCSNATVADQLQFSQAGNSFFRHPTQYEIAISLIGATALVIYVMQAAASFWRDWDATTRAMLINAYACISIYGIAYIAYAKRQLNKPVLIARGLAPQISTFVRICGAVGFSLRSMAKRIRPRFRLGVGGLMIVSTLWLLVGAPFCKGPLTGLEYLRAQQPEGWPSGPLGYSAVFHNEIIRALYMTALLTVAVSCLVLLCSFFYSRILDRNRFTLVVGDLAAALCLFFVTDLCFGNVIDFTSPEILAPLFVKVAASILAIALWVFPIWSWTRYRHIRYKSGLARWPSAQRWLLRWYYPQIIVAALFITTALLSESKPLIGAPIFILGVAILATAYSTVETAARFATNKRSVGRGIARRPVESIA